MSERRRGSGCLVAVVVLIALVAGVGIIGDKMAKDYVAEELATGARNSLNLDTTPEVTIHGWPFLYQLWQRSFDHVEGSAPAVTLSDEQRSIRINDLHLDLYTMRADEQYQNFVAERLEATGHLSWEELGRQAGNGAQVSHGGGDRIRILYSMEVFGQGIDVEASGKPVLDVAAQKLKIEDVNLRVVGMDVPQVITDELMRLRLGEIDVRLPMGLRVDELKVVDEGVALKVSGAEVPFSR